jgi:hypothetical protein
MHVSSTYTSPSLESLISFLYAYLVVDTVVKSRIPSVMMPSYRLELRTLFFSHRNTALHRVNLREATSFFYSSYCYMIDSTEARVTLVVKVSYKIKT